MTRQRRNARMIPEKIQARTGSGLHHRQGAPGPESARQLRFGPGTAAMLAQRRERGRHHQHVLLFEHAARRAATRRPDSLALRPRAHREAFGGVLVGPDVAPQVQVTEFGMAGEGERRELGAFVDLARPALDLLRDRARTHRVDADLVETAELARFELRRERRRDIDLALLLDDELARVRRPAFELCRLGALAGALFEVLIGPDMNYLVQRSDL